MSIEQEPQKEHQIAEFDPSAIKHIVFDVDDCLMRGTMAIKEHAWEEIFPGKEEEMRKAHDIFDKKIPYSDGEYYQGDRMERIAMMLGKWSPESNDHRNDPEVKEVAERFEELTRELIRTQGIHEDDLKALEELGALPGVKLHLVSNVPQESLVANFEHLGLIDRFESIVGMPTRKAEALRKIAENSGCEPEEILMVGDGNNDHDAALKVGAQFLGIIPVGSENEKWRHAGFPVSQSVADSLSLFNFS